jgi:hypothetical protein
VIVDYRTNALRVPDTMPDAALVAIAGASHTGFDEAARLMPCFIGNPDLVGCWALERWLDLSRTPDVLRELGAPENGMIVPATTPEPCRDRPPAHALAVERQQLVTRVAVSAFFESRFAPDPAARDAAAQYLADGLATDFPEATSRPIRAAARCDIAMLEERCIGPQPCFRFLVALIYLGARITLALLLGSRALPGSAPCVRNSAAVPSREPRTLNVSEASSVIFFFRFVHTARATCSLERRRLPSPGYSERTVTFGRPGRARSWDSPQRHRGVTVRRPSGSQGLALQRDADGLRHHVGQASPGARCLSDSMTRVQLPPTAAYWYGAGPRGASRRRQLQRRRLVQRVPASRAAANAVLDGGRAMRRRPTS